MYDGELAAEFGPPIAVVELDDEALRLLLRHLLESDLSVEALFRSLQGNRPVLTLARSPMLLTMIAYLYVEGVFGGRGELMPRSRWEFYEQAIAYLLRRDEARGLGEITRHGPAVKLAILRKVALLLMDRHSSDDSNDRRVITHLELLRVIRSEGEHFNLDSGQADDLIREIVERSRLLIRLEGKNDTYGFRHLTLQEYLVALELRTDWHGLLGRYSRHPEVWHEVVRLWCGLSSDDSTPLLRRIYELDGGDGKLLILRCLAEATRIDSVFSGEVIDHYVGRLESNTKLSEPTIRALGALGSASGPRGDRLMNHLLAAASRNPSAVRRNSMSRRQTFRVLAATGRADAVDALISLTPTESAARAELRSMGDLAIPALARAARDGSVWAIDDIGRIGTPAAAEALVPLLTAGPGTPESTCAPAAWWMAALLNSDDVLATLNRDQKNKEVISGDRIDWITEPFDGEWSPHLRSIIGRTAWLIRENLDGGVPDTLPPLSPLIVLPLHVELQPKVTTRLFTVDSELKELTRKIAAEDPALPSLPHIIASASDVYRLIDDIGLAAKAGSIESSTAQLADTLTTEVLRRAFRDSRPTRYDQLLSTLDSPVRWGLVAGLGIRECRRDDWENLAQPAPRPRFLGMLTKTVWTGIGLVLSVSGGVQLINTVRGVDAWGPSWLAIIAVIAVAAAVISLPVGLAMEPETIESDTAWGIFALSVIPGAPILAGNGFAATQGFLRQHVGPWNWAIIIAVLIAASWLFGVYMARVERFENPFRNLLYKYAPQLLPTRNAG
ncbi:NACHT domain-containing protein [Herbidospora yilanensis]|uniref:NACHT domain-containing protein n=1 Tax=Herbidospora yilanensis TaxID=354426 RepID=UPI000785B9BA|nr:hypothetical protein [Herbidospora yilanensis]